MRPEDYEIDIRPLSADDGGGFTAIAPELPGCRSDGETPEEALRNGYDAIACWIEAAEEMGRPVPQPRRIAA
ncbi:MAG: type II toxin-antitoxin system HicB family antitoxin [Sphingomonas sp.]|jgi:predicted RNase H-like HicB family nuclease|nr:MAG: type II toxin-antitoxin system HicB family antitoxin [Sphingomonas sp.]